MAAFSGNTIYYAIFSGKVHTYRIEIGKSGYAGTATQITNLSTNPLVYRHVHVENSAIQGSEMIFEMMLTKDQYSVYDELVNGDDFEYKFTLYNAADTTKPLWMGFVIPAQTSRGYFEKYSVFSITATDYLSSLKNLKFVDSSGYSPSGRVDPESVISTCLAKIPDFEYFTVSSSIVEAHMAIIYRSPLGRCYIRPSIFSSIKNGIRVQDNCYDVINQILQIFSCRICSPFYNLSNWGSHFNRFVISNNIEETSVNWYNRWTGSAVNYVSVTSFYSSGINIDEYKFKINSEYSREMPLKCIELVQHNFDGGLDNTTDDFMNPTNGVIWNWSGINTLVAVTTNTLRLISNAVYTTALQMKNWYTLQSDYGNSYIRIAFDLYVQPGYPSVTPVVKIYKRVGGVVQPYQSETLKSVSAGSTYKFISEPTSMYSIEDGADYLVYLEFTSSSAVAKYLYISNFKFSNYMYENGGIIDNVAFDEVYTGYTQEGMDPSIQLSTKLGDSWKAGNDSAITYSTDETDLTNDWNRSYLIESRSIQDLLMQSYFNRYGGDSRILRIDVYDPNDNISLKNKIILQGVNYLILDIEKSFLTGWATLKLLKINTTDVSYTLTQSSLPSQSTGNGGTTGGISAGAGQSVVNNYYNNTDHSKLSGLSGDDHKQYLLRVEYLLSTLVGIYAANEYFDIPIQNIILSIILETQDTTGGNFTLGSTAGVCEVATLSITAGCSSTGNCTVTLNGVSQNILLSSGFTATQVATAIRGVNYVGWTTGGTGTTVTFTANLGGTKTDATYNANSTGASGTMTTTTQGTNSSSDMVASTAIGSVDNVTKNISFKNVDAALSLTTTKRVYVGLSTTTTVKLRIVFMKF